MNSRCSTIAEWLTFPQWQGAIHAGAIQTITAIRDRHAAVFEGRSQHYSTT